MRAAASEAASEGDPPSDGDATAAAAASAAAEPGSVEPTAAKKTAGKKGKGAAPEGTHRCFHCQSESTEMMCCSQCHRAWYCGRPCQKKHWKLHKKACVAAVAAEARQATLSREATEARGGGGGAANETCVICIGPVRSPVELPCGHAYCGACLAELRAKGVARCVRQRAGGRVDMKAE